jgi:hypothetical protein
MIQISFQIGYFDSFFFTLNVINFLGIMSQSFKSIIQTHLLDKSSFQNFAVYDSSL